ncbi:MAG: hypothetical protein MK172_05090, partial [Verrucomicrobiales bacterium]|nr:hypothetical protein [Verrucomicrobiales bacterium]
MRKIILINCLWAAVAVGTFFLGKKDHGFDSLQNSGAVNDSRNLTNNEAVKRGLVRSGTIERVQKSKKSLPGSLVIDRGVGSKLKSALADSNPV